MRSLFFKIFMWFWVTVIVTGTALILTFVLEPHSVPSRWRASLIQMAHSSGSLAVEEVERGGISAGSAYVERLENETQLKACLFDLAGTPIAGTGCDTFADMFSHLNNTGRPRPPIFIMKYGIARVAILLQGGSGRKYIFATELPAGPRTALGAMPIGILLRWGIALLVSGSVCYLLTRYLTRPILQLREASQQLASGNLSTRAAPAIENRRDELGGLVRDFNIMADRIEGLLSRQRQLIYDISHELRSPLARLNVALDLARQRKGNDPSFDHMEQDMARLNEMIERILTLARLDTSAAPVEMKPVNLTALVTKIVNDASFESQERNGKVTFEAGQEYFIKGNEELLSSAIENVVRNAVRYTADGAPVEIRIRRRDTDDEPRVSLSIRDHGPGVPENELANIFQPFYRVADARDRESGGTGLGLAIADRVVRIHGGVIRAENAAPQGLRVEIYLPLLDYRTLPT